MYFQDLTSLSSLRDMFNNCTFQFLKKIQESSSNEVFEMAVNKNSDWLLDQGLAPFNLKFEDKDSLLKILFKNEIYYKWAIVYLLFMKV